MNPKVIAKADVASYIVFSVLAVPILGLFVNAAIRKPAQWVYVAVFGLIVGAIYANIASIRFSYDEQSVRYKSRLKDVWVELADVTLVKIMAEQGDPRKGRAPRFYLSRGDGKDVMINLKVLPLKTAQEFCAMLKARGLKFEVDDNKLVMIFAKKLGVL